GRLEAHEDAEHARRHAPQRHHLEPVRHDRRQHRDGEAAEQEHRRVEHRGGAGGAVRQHQQGGDGQRDGEPVETGQQPSDAGAGEDVPRPEDAGEQREGEPGQRDAAGGVGAEQDDPGGREQRPDPVDPAAGLHQRQQQRPDELDGHGDAERDGAQRQV
ncbi:MAG: hypothetical protein AVDCRST_MAG36-3130, partial [uncultured Nocardioidaceae bacterium]